MNEDKKSVLKNWKLHFIILLCCSCSDKIGNIVIHITDKVSITLMPLLYAMVLVTILYLLKPVKWVSEEGEEVSQLMLNMGCLLLIANLGVTVGTNINTVLSAGLPLLVQNFGDALTCVLALPLAVMLGMRREAVGLTFANSREPGMALMESKYGADSKEFLGSVAMYIVGTVFGTILLSLFTSIFGSLGILHPYAIAMAGGTGSTAMCVAAIGTMEELWPNMADKLTALCTTSNTISACIGTYLSIMVSVPLANFIYRCMVKKSNEEDKS